MTQIGDAIRNLFTPIMPEVVPRMIPMINSEVDTAWANAEKYGLSSASSDFPPMTAVCSTAMEDYPVLRLSEANIVPTWECEWCGNMWANDIHSCEKCGGPKGNGLEINIE